jgi:hypothetical protein
MPPHQPTHQAVIRVQEQFWQALQTWGAVRLAIILASEFVGRSPVEADQTPEEFITTSLRLPTFPFRIAEVHVEAGAVHVFGEVAILTGVQVARLEVPDGEVPSSRVLLSTVYC